jgi:hypothetical protein
MVQENRQREALMCVLAFGAQEGSDDRIKRNRKGNKRFTCSHGSY